MARDKSVAAASFLLTTNNKGFLSGILASRKKWEGFVNDVKNLNETKLNNSKFGQGIVNGLSKMTPYLGVINSGLNAIANTAKFTATALATVGGVSLAGLAAGITKSVNEAAKLEDEALNLKLVMGDEAGGEMTKWIQNFYPTTSGSRSVFLQAAADLARMGKGEDEIKRLLQAFGDAGSMGKDTDKGIQGLTDTFRRLEMQGSLTSRTVREFLKYGIDFSAILAEKLGGAEQAQKALKDGSISAAQAEMMFMEYMGQYYGAMQERSNTAAGTLQTIQAQINNLWETIGEAFLPFLQQIGGSIQDLLGYIQQNMGNIAPLINELIQLTMSEVNGFVEWIDKVQRLGRAIQIVGGFIIDFIIAPFKMAYDLVKLIYDQIVNILQLDFKGYFKDLKNDLYNLGKDTAAPVENALDRYNAAAKVEDEGGGVRSALNKAEQSFYKYGFAPSQVAAGMQRNAVQRANDEAIRAANRDNYRRGSEIFAQNMQQADEMADGIKSIDDKMSRLLMQNTAGVNAAIPVR